MELCTEVIVELEVGDGDTFDVDTAGVPSTWLECDVEATIESFKEVVATVVEEKSRSVW